MSDDSATVALLSSVAQEVRDIRRKMDGDARLAAESRRGVYQKLDDHGKSLLDMGHRLRSVEKSVSDATPTLEEFKTYKHQVHGAGKLGRSLWRIGAVLLAAAAALYAVRDKVLAALQAGLK